MLDQVSCVRIFRALANPHRLHVLLAGVEAVRSGCCTSEFAKPADCQKAVAKALGIGRSTMSYHMKELAACGLVRVERDGQKVSWSLDPRGVTLLREFVAQLDGAEGLARPDAIFTESDVPVDGA
jgi:DNA-binding transcriptional ArsR family regulator